ncbi:hypothetical protein E2C01_097823 [Portunus trituberculatus]|uniref:Uncharacterized protein n=1 Tax=Portunus trituberculatus TaxID=210409 RepID=A0A5B7JW71_PORTR|nr:hypothetical protein [Portunus trituberculatus]
MNDSVEEVEKDSSGGGTEAGKQGIIVREERKGVAWLAGRERNEERVVRILSSYNFYEGQEIPALGDTCLILL